MRAAVLREVGKPLVIEELSLEGPRAGEVRLRIAASGICGSDLANAKGTLRTPRPVVLGHEAAGEVLELGAGVKDLAPGDRVVVSLSPECGECIFCREGKPHFCVQMMPGMLKSTLVDGTTRLKSGGEAIYQLCGVGSFAEQAVVCASSCIRVPEGLPLERACLLGCGVLTGAGAVLNTARVERGMSVAVIGCGGVGLSAVQAARIAGAGAIIAVDVDPAKLDLARELGATHAVDGHGEVVAQVRATQGLGVHVAIEAIGKTETIETAWAMLRPGGLAVVIGMPAAREQVRLRVGGFFQEKRISGCVYGSAHPHRDIPHLMALARRGEQRLDPLVSEELPLERVQQAMDSLARGEGARHVIVNRAPS
jgi:S-(hydroxymethyl)glutathione dehydrogenase/alcohol dehydrogenase